MSARGQQRLASLALAAAVLLGCEGSGGSTPTRGLLLSVFFADTVGSTGGPEPCARIAEAFRGSQALSGCENDDGSAIYRVLFQENPAPDVVGIEVLLANDGPRFLADATSLRNDGEYTATIVVPDEPTCDDGMDDDGDGLVDCADPGCASVCKEICGNLLDDDGDGDADCDDSDCDEHIFCNRSPATEIDCDNMTDDDGDTLVDCADPDCQTPALCPDDVETCGNGVDDNGNGLADCAEQACLAACLPKTTAPTITGIVPSMIAIFGLSATPLRDSSLVLISGAAGHLILAQPEPSGMGVVALGQFGSGPLNLNGVRSATPAGPAPGALGVGVYGGASAIMDLDGARVRGALGFVGDVGILRGIVALDAAGTRFLVASEEATFSGIFRLIVVGRTAGGVLSIRSAVRVELPQGMRELVLGRRSLDGLVVIGGERTGTGGVIATIAVAADDTITIPLAVATPLPVGHVELLDDGSVVALARFASPGYHLWRFDAAGTLLWNRHVAPTEAGDVLVARSVSVTSVIRVSGGLADVQGDEQGFAVVHSLAGDLAPAPAPEAFGRLSADESAAVALPLGDKILTVLHGGTTAWLALSPPSGFSSGACFGRGALDVQVTTPAFASTSLTPSVTPVTLTAMPITVTAVATSPTTVDACQ